MDRLSFLKSLAPGFLPLIVYIAADAMFGTTWGLIIAVFVGMIELLVSYLRDKTIDRFVLIDMGLIILLGSVSIFLNNDIFFLLKPAVIELLFCGILGISVFSKHNLIMMMSKRYLKNMDISAQQLNQVTQSIKPLFYIFLLHTWLIVYAAFAMSKQAWAFISGGLFYILFAVFFVWQWLKKKIAVRKWAETYKNDEWFDIVNSKGQVKGKAPRTICHQDPKLLHQVVHIHLIDSKNRIYLQKRSMKKEVFPGYWDTAIGGHVQSGETIPDAIKREAFEELSLKEFKVAPMATFIWKSNTESELVHMFLIKSDQIPRFNPEEIDDASFWKVKKIKESLKKGVFTPCFELEFSLLLKIYFKETQ